MVVVRRKILVVGPIPPPHTGTEVMTRALLNSTVRERFRLWHLNTSRRRAVETKGRFDFQNVFWGVWHLGKLIARVIWTRPAVVVLPFAQNRAATLRDVLFVAASHAFGSRVVCVFHSATFDEFYGACGAAWRTFLRAGLVRADMAVVLADTLRDQLSGLVPTARIRVCGNGIDGTPFREARSRKLADDSGPDTTAIRLLFVGHLSYAKGLADLLVAFGKAAEQDGRLHLTVIGSPIAIERNVTVDIARGQSIDQMLEDLRREFPDRISTPGVITGERKVRLFAESDIFVLPSYSEASPVSVLEAMAAGLAIVATNVGAIPEMLTSDTHGILVVPGDRDGISRAILRLAHDERLRARFGETAQRVQAEAYSLEVYADKFGQLLSDAAEQSLV
jgi:glycosyltransferase involved in cell wall biosynthesis